METFAILILIILILGVYTYIQQPSSNCHHDWENKTLIDNEDNVTIEHICKKCGKITSTIYYKTLK